MWWSKPGAMRCCSENESLFNSINSDFKIHTNCEIHIDVLVAIFLLSAFSKLIFTQIHSHDLNDWANTIYYSPYFLSPHHIVYQNLNTALLFVHRGGAILAASLTMKSQVIFLTRV
jgi:ABC-type polysaccharide transport system permease subunit